MHQKSDDDDYGYYDGGSNDNDYKDDWKIEDPPLWIGRLSDDLEDHIDGGWTSCFHVSNALAFLGMLEIDQILTPILRTAIGPINVFWPKGTNERLEVTIKSIYCCHVVRKFGEFTKEEYDCGPLGLRTKLLDFYPFVKNNFDRKFKV